MFIHSPVGKEQGRKNVLLFTFRLHMFPMWWWISNWWTATVLIAGNWEGCSKWSYWTYSYGHMELTWWCRTWMKYLDKHRLREVESAIKVCGIIFFKAIEWGFSFWKLGEWR
jgi:hypothetical protein